MNLKEYDYNLPEELIAQLPLKDREKSRLLIMDKTTGILEETIFENILNKFKQGDCLVLNNTKVLPARIIGVKDGTGAVIELLLLKNITEDIWECLAKPAKRLKVDTTIIFSDDLKATVKEKKEDGIVIIKFVYEKIFLEILEALGTMPLPPYIHEKLEDKNRYQTVYAKEIGSAAAPTAGLHFTKNILEKLEEKGVNILYITLHVGLGTFRPVEVENVLEHKMHSEWYSVSKSTADSLNKAKAENRSIYAVGTTTCRTLETVMQKYNKFVDCYGDTDIFIYPGFKFKAIDGLITNFHLPKSTLLMLVSALSSKKNIMNAYNYAIEHKFRFFSFGDAMFITNNKENKE